MNNAYVMSASFEARKNSQATMITVGFAGLLLLLMFLCSWTVTAVEPPPADEGVMVELNMPADEPIPPPIKNGNSGGGGGEKVEAPGKAGIAPPSPPDPGTKDDAKDIDEDPKEHTSPAILKPSNPKPDAKKINENKTPIKVAPKPDPTPPAPPKPKATLGHTTTGNQNGGNETATQYPTTGGKGTGYRGAGDTKGDGGGEGGGFGGGKGTGAGPYVSRGDRSIIGGYSFQGDLDKATIYADIKVSPEGTGQFLQFARGSSSQNSSYRTAIEQYLRKMKFNKSDHESTVTVVFNFKVNG